jgi:hypothetical protein
VISEYLSPVSPRDGIVSLSDHPRSGGNGLARIKQLRILDAQLQPVGSIPMGGILSFEISYQTPAQLHNLEFVIGVYDTLMRNVCQFSSSRSGFASGYDPGSGKVLCHVPAFQLTAGRYYANLAIVGASGREIYDHITQAIAFDVVESDVLGTGKIPDPRGGPCYFASEWSSGAT